MILRLPMLFVASRGVHGYSGKSGFRIEAAGTTLDHRDEEKHFANGEFSPPRFDMSELANTILCDGFRYGSCLGGPIGCSCGVTSDNIVHLNITLRGSQKAQSSPYNYLHEVPRKIDEQLDRYRIEEKSVRAQIKKLKDRVMRGIILRFFELRVRTNFLLILSFF